jgi:FlaA1/EpsC-like NDP-sugar epimerase
VLLLYSACLIADAIALAVVTRVGPNYMILLGAGVFAALAWIRRLDYPEFQPLRNGMLLPLFSLRFLTQRGLQVVCDIAFSVLSFLLALIVRVGWPLDDFHRVAFFHHAPVLAAVQIGAFALCGVYSRSYRYSGLGDLLILMRGLALASVGTLLVSRAAEFGNYPGIAVITLDLYFFASLAMIARFSFDLLDYQFQSNQGRKSRVLICGAQQAGLLVVKYILSNPALDMKIAGFLDDDSSTKNFCGFSVFRTEAFNDLITQRLIDEIVLTTDKIPDKSLKALVTRCRLADIRIRRFSVAWSEVDPSRLGELTSPDRRLGEPVRQSS